MSAPRGRVLLVSYNFPPGGGVGAFRAAKFAKYLSEDWDVDVLTASSNAVETRATLSDLPDSLTVRECSVPWSDAPVELNKLRWTPNLVSKITNLNSTHDYDAIWQTAGPFMPLASVPVVARRIDAPVVVDFRDSWTLMPYKPELTLFGRLYYALSHRIEPRVLNAAAAVTTATEGMTSAYESEYPRIAERFATIPNGYDPDDFPDVDAMTDSDAFRIVYAGKFGWYRDVEPFLRALAELATEYDVEFVHAGREEPEVVETARKFGIESAVECIGYVERAELTRRIRGADLGLAISGGSDQEMTTKIFDYIACETPILACGPESGSMANVVRRFENGVVAPNTTTEILRSLRTLCENPADSLGDGPYEEYTRERSAEKLDALLRSLTGHE